MSLKEEKAVLWSNLELFQLPSSNDSLDVVIHASKGTLAVLLPYRRVCLHFH